MALTSFQRGLCRTLAHSRAASSAAKQSCVAGGVALNRTLDAPHLSRDVHLFHDTLEALDATWNSDRALLQRAGYSFETIRARPGFVEAEVWREQDGLHQSVLVQWVRDSAFRFFPLLPHPDFGLTLHPLDLATNKVLALVGRVEVRHWVDALTCHHEGGAAGPAGLGHLRQGRGLEPATHLGRSVPQRPRLARGVGRD